MQLNKTVLLACLIFLTATGYSQVISPPDSIVFDGKAFPRVEEEASYPGGVEVWRKFLEKNINPGVPADNGAPIGKYTVIVQFIVDTGGNISDVTALTHLGYGMEQEVVKFIKKSGAWSPAMINKKPVKAYRKQPVTFMVSQEGFDITSKVPYILFTGVDNELTIEVDKVKSENLKLTISQGSIAMTNDGKFIAKVNKPGRAIIVVYTKKNKEIATVSFEVIFSDK